MLASKFLQGNHFFDFSKSFSPDMIEEIDSDTAINLLQTYNRQEIKKI